MGKKGFVPIAFKVNVMVLLILVLGIGAASFIQIWSGYREIDDIFRSSANREANAMGVAIRSIMLPGQASLAVEQFRKYREVNPDTEVKLYRADGASEAFTDNATIRMVNAILESSPSAAFQSFPERPGTVRSSEPVVRAEFDRAAATPPDEQVFFTRENAGKVQFRYYKPLLNTAKCSVCHGFEHTIRGVIDIRMDITRYRDRQAFLAGGSALLFLLIVSVVAAGISWFFRRSVIAPVRGIGRLCAEVTGGEFSHRVQVGSNDEIGDLARTVNAMVDGLHERFALSKYVSAGTIRSVRESLKGESDSESGRRVTMTMLFTDIRGFTAYSESRDPQVVVRSLNAVLSVQTDIIHRHGGDVDKYVGDAILAGFPDPVAACRAALELQAETSANHDRYDGLRLGAGINSGEVILGRVGSETRADFTVIGDNVNVASRLCSSAKAGEILLADATARSVRTVMNLRGPYRLKAKGKSDEVRVWYLVSAREVV